MTLRNGIELYKKFIDELVEMSRSCADSNAVKTGKIPGIDAANKEINKILKKLNQKERNILSEFILDTYNSGIYDTLEQLEWLRCCKDMVITVEGENLPLGKYEGISCDYIGRRSGKWEWPDDNDKLEIIEWTPKWYELDQCIVVGDVDLFYLTNEKLFASDLDEDDYEVRAEIVSINHSQLGKIRGIITIGLDYTIYLWDGRVLCVNAEEEPGKIENDAFDIKEWKFDVDIKIIEKTGFTAKERISNIKPSERKSIHNERTEKYKRLLGISYAEWENK